MNNLIISKEEHKAKEQLEQEFWEMALWGIPNGKIPDPPKPRRLWALIKVNGKQITTLMDPDTMNAYVTKDYECTDEKIASFEFVRWARMMDL